MGAESLLLTNFKKGGIILANRCFLCEEEEETVNHLLLHCLMAKLLWNLFLDIVGIQWVFPCSVKGTLLSWHDSFVGKKQLKAWMADPLSLFWSIWQERNMITFGDEHCSVHRLKTSFLFNLGSWSTVHMTKKSNSLINFLSLMGCRWGLVRIVEGWWVVFCLFLSSGGWFFVPSLSFSCCSYTP